MSFSISPLKLVFRVYPKYWTRSLQLFRTSTGSRNRFVGENEFIYKCVPKIERCDIKSSQNSNLLLGKKFDYVEQELEYTLIDSKESATTNLESTNDRLTYLVNNCTLADSKDLSVWLSLTDIFFANGIAPRYLSTLIDRLAKQNEIICSREQLLQLLFLLTVGRKHHGFLSKYNSQITMLLENATFEDVVVISAAYFKTKSRINNPEALAKSIDIVRQNIPHINFSEPGYCTAVKFIRYSCHLECRHHVISLVYRIIAYQSRKRIFDSSFNASQTIKLMETYKIYNESLLEQVTSNMSEKLDEYRIKDVQYLITSISNFSYKNDRLLEIFDRLSDVIVSGARADVNMIPFHTMPLLRAMAILGYYNDSLVDYASQMLANSRSFDRAKHALEFDRSALLYYVATRMEGGARKFLDNQDQIVKSINSRIDRNLGITGSIDQGSFIEKTDDQSSLKVYNAYCDVITALTKTKFLKDPSFRFTFQHTFPHQNYSDMVVTKDCPAPGKFDAKTLMPQQVSDNQRHVLLMAIRNYDFIDSHDRLSGYKVFITRLLNKLGYTVIHMNLDRINISNLAVKIRDVLEGRKI